MNEFFEGIKKGLEEAIAYQEGKITARVERIALKPIKEYEAADIKKIREKAGLTQADFGVMLGVSQKAVEKWEAGKRNPGGTVKRMLEMLEKDPQMPERYGIIVIGDKKVS